MALSTATAATREGGSSQNFTPNCRRGLDAAIIDTRRLVSSAALVALVRDDWRCVVADDGPLRGALASSSLRSTKACPTWCSRR